MSIAATEFPGSGTEWGIGGSITQLCVSAEALVQNVLPLPVSTAPRAQRNNDMYFPFNDSGELPKTVCALNAGPSIETSKLRGDVQADIAVIGVGYVGLSAALHATETGARVVVIEAQQIGWGSAGCRPGFGPCQQARTGRRAAGLRPRIRRPAERCRRPRARVRP